MRIFLVGDMAILWEGLAQVLSRRDPSWSIVRLTSIADVVRRLARGAPNVVVIQSQLPDGSACEAVAALNHAAEDVRAVVLGIGSHNDGTFLAALEQGASGFIDSTASLEELLTCVRRVAAGDTYIPHTLALRLADEYRARSARRTPDGSELTERELEVLDLLAQGYSNKAMANELVVSEHTIRSHLRNIMHKLSAENRVQAVARATREGLLPTASIPEAPSQKSALTA